MRGNVPAAGVSTADRIHWTERVKRTGDWMGFCSWGRALPGAGDTVAMERGRFRVDRKHAL